MGIFHETEIILSVVKRDILSTQVDITSCLGIKQGMLPLGDHIIPLSDIVHDMAILPEIIMHLFDNQLELMLQPGRTISPYDHLQISSRQLLITR
jgi:hypothetical protein